MNDATRRRCCGSEPTEGHADGCAVLVVPDTITPEVMRLALMKLAKIYGSGPVQARIFALEYAVEVGRRLAAEKRGEAEEARRCAEWDEVLP